jgi:hypothetical protein
MTLYDSDAADWVDVREVGAALALSSLADRRYRGHADW